MVVISSTIIATFFQFLSCLQLYIFSFPCQTAHLFVLVFSPLVVFCCKPREEQWVVAMTHPECYTVYNFLTKSQISPPLLHSASLMFSGYGKVAARLFSRMFLMTSSSAPKRPYSPPKHFVHDSHSILSFPSLTRVTHQTLLTAH